MSEPSLHQTTVAETLRELARNAVPNEHGTGTNISVRIGYAELVAYLDAAADALGAAARDIDYQQSPPPPTGTAEAMAEAMRLQSPATPTRFFYSEQKEIKDDE